MAFGQPAGPPASGRQMEELLTLLHDVGHSDFRDARGPMGFNQRQAAGRFTRDEAATFIDRLQAAVSDDTDKKDTTTGDTIPDREREGLSPGERALRAMPAEQLARELHRRGWIVIEP